MEEYSINNNSNEELFCHKAIKDFVIAYIQSGINTSVNIDENLDFMNQDLLLEALNSFKMILNENCQLKGFITFYCFDFYNISPNNYRTEFCSV